MFTRSSRRPLRLLTAGAVVAIGLGLAAPLGAAQAVGSSSSGGWHWNRSHGDAANGLACPTPKLCVGIDGNKVAWTTNPTANKPHWKRAALEPSSQPDVQGGVILDSLSCPSANFCITVDDLGNSFATTNPTGGKRAWHEAEIDNIEILRVSCASASLCAALDYYGNALTSTNPGAGAPTWRYASLTTVPSAEFYGVSCAGHAVCAAVEGTSTIWTTDNANSATPTWHHAKVRGKGWDGVACPTSGRCVAVGTFDFGDKVAVTNNASTSKPSWKTAKVHSSGDSSGLSRIDCPTKSFCFAVGDVFTAHAAAKTSAWHGTTLPTIGSQTEVSCASTTWCFVATSTDDFIAGKH